MQICHKYRKHHLQYMIIEFINILQMKRSKCVSKRKPNENAIRRIQPNEVRAFQRNQMKRSKGDYENNSNDNTITLNDKKMENLYLK